ncbi:MAG: hypothetical protein IAG13_03770 [Deltaproteobacteria bacterium]|nr:hypothetical protein [Nannocystaceae bacterium]
MSHYARAMLLLSIAGCADASGDLDAGDSETGMGPTTSGSTATTAPSTSPTTASASSTDASSEADSTSDAPVETSSGSESTGTPAETIPVFVALGDGGWSASSCDRGHSWTTQAFSEETGDHTQWTAFGGLAYGNGAFVAGLGWGGEGGHILASTTGRDFEDLAAASFVDDGNPVGYSIYTSGVAATGDELLVFSQRVWRSTNGVDWVTTDVSLPPGAEQLRQLRGFPDEGLVVASVESQSGNEHPQGHFVVVSDDAGASWSEGSGYSSGCSDPIQHWGDIEMVGDVLLVGTGDICRSADRGASWELGTQPTGGQIQDLAHDGDGFLAVTGSQIFRSSDGLEWSMLGDAGVPLRAVAWAAGSYAAVSAMGTDALWSDDGITWVAGTLDAAPSAGIYVRDFLGVAVEGECAG